VAETIDVIIVRIAMLVDADAAGHATDMRVRRMHTAVDDSDANDACAQRNTSTPISNSRANAVER